MRIRLGKCASRCLVNSTTPLLVKALPVLNQACKISFVSARKAICGGYERAPFFFGLKPLALPSCRPQTVSTVESTSIHWTNCMPTFDFPERSNRRQCWPRKVCVSASSWLICAALSSLKIRNTVAENQGNGALAKWWFLVRSRRQGNSPIRSALR